MSKGFALAFAVLGIGGVYVWQQRSQQSTADGPITPEEIEALAPRCLIDGHLEYLLKAYDPVFYAYEDPNDPSSPLKEVSQGCNPTHVSGMTREYPGTFGK